MLEREWACEKRGRRSGPVRLGVPVLGARGGGGEGSGAGFGVGWYGAGGVRVERGPVRRLSHVDDVLMHSYGTGKYSRWKHP